MLQIPCDSAADGRFPCSWVDEPTSENSMRAVFSDQRHCPIDQSVSDWMGYVRGRSPLMRLGEFPSKIKIKCDFCRRNKGEDVRP